jgi:hypothetical protein
MDGLSMLDLAGDDSLEGMSYDHAEMEGPTKGIESTAPSRGPSQPPLPSSPPNCSPPPSPFQVLDNLLRISPPTSPPSGIPHHGRDTPWRSPAVSTETSDPVQQLQSLPLLPAIGFTNSAPFQNHTRSRTPPSPTPAPRNHSSPIPELLSMVDPTKKQCRDDRDSLVDDTGDTAEGVVGESSGGLSDMRATKKKKASTAFTATQSTPKEPSQKASAPTPMTASPNVPPPVQKNFSALPVYDIPYDAPKWVKQGVDMLNTDAMGQSWVCLVLAWFE